MRCDVNVALLPPVVRGGNSVRQAKQKTLLINIWPPRRQQQQQQTAPVNSRNCFRPSFYNFRPFTNSSETCRRLAAAACADSQATLTGSRYGRASKKKTEMGRSAFPQSACPVYAAKCKYRILIFWKTRGGSC